MHGAWASAVIPAAAALGRLSVPASVFGLAGRDARPLRTRPWLGLGLFCRRLRGWLWRLAVVEVMEDAVSPPLALTGSVHTSKFVRMVLQAGGAMFETLLGVRGPGYPAFRL